MKDIMFCRMKTATYVLLAFSTAFPIVARAEPNDEVDGEVVRVASKLLIDKHRRQDIDQRQLSLAWGRRFMLTLDPRRMHFLASDADELLKLSTSLVADAQKGELQFPVLVAKRFRTRLDANASLIDKLLAAEHDFTIDESVQSEHQKYAADKKESGERWRLRIKYELVMEKNNAADAKSSCDFLHARYSRIQKHFRSLSPSKILSLFIDALAKSLDPHSACFDEQYLRMYRTSHIPNYTLGMRLKYRQGDLWIQPSPHDALIGGQALYGRRIVAVRRNGEEAIHLSGLTDGAAIRTIISPIEELGHAKTVILEIDDPKRGSRITVACDRWLPGR